MTTSNQEKNTHSTTPTYKRVLALVALALIAGLIIAFLLVALFGGPESKNVFVGLAGAIVAVHTLDPLAKEVIMMSANGQAIRVAVKEIPTLGRATQGVRIMRLSEGDKVASIGIVLPEEEKEE